MPKTNSSEYYVKLAKKNGLTVVEGGSHTKIHGPAGRGYMAVPRHATLSKGVECNVKKWFRTLGILCLLVVPMTCLLVALAA